MTATSRAALLVAPLPTANAIVDASGLLCPLPIVRLSQALRRASVGDVIHVIATDPGFFPDLERWLRVRPLTLAALRQTGDARFEAWIHVDSLG